jgi:CRISPR-associated endonuclease Csn1
MGYRLGLDVGTSSLGWALLDDNHIVDCGVRIFEMGNKVTKNGEESRRQDRTLARSARRRLQRYKLRRKNLVAILERLGMLPDADQLSDSFRLYQLRAQALDQQISLNDLGRIWLYINKKRGFKSNAIVERSSKEDGAVAKGIAELRLAIQEAGLRTVGEYFFELKQAHHNGQKLGQRILGHWIDRSQYLEEFNLIWVKQVEFYPNILTPDLLKEVRDRTIFYQRKLKSQKHLINKCRFEPSKRVAPKSHPLYQEFRMWQQIANLRITHGDRVNDPVTPAEREILLELLSKKGEVDIDSSTVKKALRLSSNDLEYNDVPLKMKGLDTEVKLKKALGTDFYDKMDEAMKERLWHTLYFFDDTDNLIKLAQSSLNLTQEQAEAYARVSLEPDYGSISIKAINKVLPYLRLGQRYDEACLNAGYHHSYSDEKQSKDRKLLDEVPVPDHGKIRNPVVLKSLYQIRGVVNALIKDFGKPEIVRIEFARALKMPRQKRERIRIDNMNREKERREYAEFLISKGINVHWKDSMVDKYRLWLELGCEAEDIEDFGRFNDKYRKQHAEKFKLWMECNRISPYTGKTITLSRLFDADIEIEHIIPYSKSLDNSFMNKSLCERSENLRKNNRLPREYMSEGEFLAMKQRIKSLPGPKRDRFLMENVPDGFLNSQLSDTGYIAKSAKDLIAQAILSVEEVPGQATSQLRGMWRLNDLLHAPEEVDSALAINKEISKNRQDHRHHLLDAIVVASTSRGMIHQLARENQFQEDGRPVRGLIIDEPYDMFKADVKDVISKVFVSHENRKRLLTRSINTYRHWKKSVPKPKQSLIAPRGSMHEETHYGYVLHPETGQYVYAAKKGIDGISENEIARILDPVIREEVRRHVAEFGKIDLKKAPLLIEKKMFGEYRYIPIRHVRLASRATSMVALRPSTNPNLFVPTGNNYCIALYEGEVKGQTKRVYRSVPFLEAVKKSQAGERFFPDSVFENGVEFDLHMVLKANDYLVLYDNHPDEIEWSNPQWLFDRLYYVVKWNGSTGQIVLHKHYVSELNPDTSPKPVVIRMVPNTLNGAKVMVDRLGRFYKL